jgi:hypothetical protein
VDDAYKQPTHLDSLCELENMDATNELVEMRLSRIHWPNWEIELLIRVINCLYSTFSSPLEGRLLTLMRSSFDLIGVDWPRVRYSLDRKPLPYDYAHVTLYRQLPHVNWDYTISTCSKGNCDLNWTVTTFTVFVDEIHGPRNLFSIVFNNNRLYTWQ